MTVDEMIIQIRVTAEGVKQGVAVAVKELKELEKEKEKLRQELKFKIESSGILELKKELSSLQAEKQELEKAVKFPIESIDVENLRQALRELDNEKKKIEQKLEVHLELKEEMQLRDRLEEIKKLRAETQATIQLEVRTDAEAAVKALGNVNKEIASIERQISVKIETEGINKVSSDLKDLTADMQNKKKLEEQLCQNMVKTGAVAAAVFAGIVAATKSGIDTYIEVAEAQTKLNNIMGVTMNATSSQFKEIIKITKEYEKVGVVSAHVQQAGAQELATYLTKTDSLKKLLPVMNDITAQQSGYNATAGQAVTIATMLGKVMDGQTGALSRYGYKFTEAQEEIIKFGNETERVAVLIDVISASIGGTNEELGKTDAGAIMALSTEAVNASEAFGSALIPIISEFAKLLTGIVKSVADFTNENKAFVAGLTAFGITVTGVTVIVAAFKAVLAQMTAESIAALAAFITTLGPLGLTSGYIPCAGRLRTNGTRKKWSLFKS